LRDCAHSIVVNTHLRSGSRIFFSRLYVTDSYAFIHHCHCAITSIVQVDADIRTILLKPDAPQPTVLACRVWPKAIPQYQKGHLAILAELEKGLDAAPGLLLAGNYRTGVAFGDCVQYGYEEAEKIAQYLGKAPAAAAPAAAAPAAAAAKANSAAAAKANSATAAKPAAGAAQDRPVAAKQKELA
jgi:hypothetical protein